MLERLFPKERDFFPSFDLLSQCLSDSTVELLAAIEGKSDRSECLENAKKLEIRANQIVRESIEHLHLTFVTPFDRSHIFRLLVLQSEIVSLIRILTEKLGYFSLDKLPIESVEIVVQCGKSCILIRQMISQMKKIKNPSEVLKICLSVYEIVAQNNLLAFEAIKDFNQDIVQLLKIKEINRDLVSITKKFESISFLIEEIILEYA